MSFRIARPENRNVLYVYYGFEDGQDDKIIKKDHYAEVLICHC